MSFENLKERPTEERKAVAWWVAAAVVVILFLGWAFLFFQRMQNNSPVQNTAPVAQTPGNAASSSGASPNLKLVPFQQPVAPVSDRIIYGPQTQ